MRYYWYISSIHYNMILIYSPNKQDVFIPHHWDDEKTFSHRIWRISNHGLRIAIRHLSSCMITPLCQKMNIVYAANVNNMPLCFLTVKRISNIDPKALCMEYWHLTYFYMVSIDRIYLGKIFHTCEHMGKGWFFPPCRRLGNSLVRRPAGLDFGVRKQRLDLTKKFEEIRPRVLRFCWGFVDEHQVL